MKIIINYNKFSVAVSGHVGPPLPCCHIKLIDVPEMEYFAVNGQGEVFFFSVAYDSNTFRMGLHMEIPFAVQIPKYFHGNSITYGDIFGISICRR